MSPRSMFWAMWWAKKWARTWRWATLNLDYDSPQNVHWYIPLPRWSMTLWSNRLRGSSYSLHLNSLTVLLDNPHRLPIRVVPTPSHNPSRMANRSSLDSGSWLEVRGPISRRFSSSSAIGRFFLVGGIPLRGVLNVTLCLLNVAQPSLNRYL